MNSQLIQRKSVTPTPVVTNMKGQQSSETIETVISKPGVDHWSYVWLLAGFVLLTLSNGTSTIIPIATWLAPVFLMRFLRTQTKTIGLTVFAPVFCTAWVIMLYDMYPGIIGNGFGIFYGVVFFFPFLADRLLAPNVADFRSTLVFPCAWVTMEFMLSFTFANSWFSLAYTQHGNLPLMQLVSVTGIWGVSFLIAWFAAVVNWAWARDFRLSETRIGVSLYLVSAILVWLLGGAYMTLVPAGSTTVRAAAVTRSFDMDVLAKGCQADVPCLRDLFSRSLDEFLDDSKEAANTGARIIVWQENGIAVYADDEADFIERAREFSIRERVYLLMGIKMLSTDRSVDENKAVLVSPSGQMSEYLKNHAVIGDSHILGDGRVLLEDSPYGRLAAMICYDADYPSFVRQAGRANVDLMLMPYHDWRAITPLHANMASFRAIENGFSMIRADYKGLSTAVDYHGNILSQMNDFTTDERVMIADLPSHGITTIYSQIGDLAAWLCVLGFCTLAWSGTRRQA